MFGSTRLRRTLTAAIGSLLMSSVALSAALAPAQFAANPAAITVSA